MVVVGIAAVAIAVFAWEASAVPTLTSSLHSTLIFSDHFQGTTLDASKWNSYVTSRAGNGRPWNDPLPDPNGGGSGIGCQYSAQYYLPSQVRTGNGLELTASRDPTTGRCSETDASSTFPWRSGAVSTYNHFEFDGGYVAVTMDAPSGNGMWPALWMLPGPGGGHGDDAEIDLQEGGFAPPGPGNETYAWHLRNATTTSGGAVDTRTDLTSGYHTYALNWVPGKSITWFFDSHQIATLTSAQADIPNEPMELIMDLAVATPAAASWHPTYDPSTPSPATMRVASVQVWTAPPS
jgi:beta-glucanase (GH16 family)